MAAKSTTTKKIASEVNVPERPARAIKPRAPRVKAATHARTIIAAPSPEDSQTVIARIAYGFWEARGHQGGSALEDWLRAEQTYRQSAI